ncbi:MAG: VanZ family protein [Microscillaceae bacterium]|nr:VanZ family protein [Microscillaceae bacterium]
MFFKNTFYAILWATIMFLLNLGREQGLPPLKIFYYLYFDKLAHFLQFLLLAFFLVVGFEKQYAFQMLRFKSIQYTLIISVLYAILLEIIQLIRFKEYFEIWDLIANIFGCLVGVIAFYIIYKY